MQSYVEPFWTHVYFHTKKALSEDLVTFLSVATYRWKNLYWFFVTLGLETKGLRSDSYKRKLDQS